MQWEVTGADRATGEEVSMILEADNEAAAIRGGNRNGVMVASAIPCKVEDPLESIAKATGSMRQVHTNPRYFIICPNPNCGFRGEGKKKQKANTGISVVLMLLWLGFGVLYGLGRDPAAWIASIAAFISWMGYTILLHGKYFLCPRCGTKARDA